MAVRRVLVVTRDGHLDSEQLFLLYFVRWLRDHARVEVDVLTWEEGPLTEDLRDGAKVQVLAELNTWRPARAAEVLRLQRVAQAVKGLRLRWWLLRRRDVDVVYVNGFDSARILGFELRPGPPVVVHVHDAAELDSLSPDDQRLVARRSTRFVVPDEALAAELADHLGVPRSRIRCHDYLVVGAGQLPASDHPPARADLGLGPDDVVVGGTGTTDWWAAPDQFVLLAWELRRRRPEARLRFLWIAGTDDERRLWPLHHDLANAGVDDVTVVSTRHRPLDVLGLMDVLVLSTRDGGQELLALEAATRDIPVVITDNLGNETLGPALAEIVPYLDVERLADATLAVLEDDARRADRVARARAAARPHHDRSVGSDQLVELLDGL